MNSSINFNDYKIIKQLVCKHLLCKKIYKYISKWTEKDHNRYQTKTKMNQSDGV